MVMACRIMNYTIMALQWIPVSQVDIVMVYIVMALKWIPVSQVLEHPPQPPHEATAQLTCVDKHANMCANTGATMWIDICASICVDTANGCHVRKHVHLICLRTCVCTCLVDLCEVTPPPVSSTDGLCTPTLCTMAIDIRIAGA